MLNVVVLTGRLVADPELRHTSSDIAVTSFTIAVNRRFARPGEERQTDFIDIVAWRNTAEFICKYFGKGQLIAIEGSIQTGSYQDKDGNKRKTFEVVARDAQFAESKRESLQEPSYGDSSSSVESGLKAEKSDSYSSGSDNDFQTIESDDDLPF